ncbi:MAG: hypothetical protein JO056_10530 [Alphaproteobacteria bacterium]|nr:hypothetical protein [Alphaproteobacteria bacterium]
MVQTRRNLFKTAVVSAIGAASISSAVRAGGRKVHQRILLRWPQGNPSASYLFVPEGDGIKVYDVSVYVKPSVQGMLNLDDLHLDKPITKAITFSINGKTINVGDDGFVKDDELPSGLIMTKWAEVGIARKVTKHN